MESILEENNKLKFPFLGVGSNGNVILFASPGVGTVVYKSPTTDYELGRQGNTYCMDMFKPLVGTLTLRN